jgi:hypothetical protein
MTIMRKFLALAFMVLACVAGCGQHMEAAAPATTSAGPVATTAPEVDYRQDVTRVTASAASLTEYPEGGTLDVTMTITNHGDQPATYEIVLAVYDSTTAQVGTVLVSTSASNYGPTKPGGVLLVSGAYGMGGKLPDPFTVEVQSVDRVPA